MGGGAPVDTAMPVEHLRARNPETGWGREADASAQDFSEHAFEAIRGEGFRQKSEGA